MIKFYFIALMSIALTACAPDPDWAGPVIPDNMKFRVICVDGFEYLYRSYGHDTLFTVRLEQDTRQPKRCEPQKQTVVVHTPTLSVEEH